MNRRDYPSAVSRVPLPRRLVLFLAGAAFLVPRTRFWQPLGSPNSLDTQILALLAPLRTQSAKSIGQVVVDGHPEMTDEKRVVARLLKDLELDGQSVLRVSRTQMATLIAERVRDDFERERVVNVAGWRLAQTEARLCALAAHYVG